MTVRETIAQGSAELKAAGINTPSLDASLLLAFSMNTDRTALIAKGADQLSQPPLDSFREYIKRRINGECVAYITGKKEFFGLDFIVNHSVLVPRPDTEILVEAAAEEVKNEKRKMKKGKSVICILDLCTGSGAAAIALKHTMPELEIFAVDISKEALETAKENALRLLPNGSTIHFYQGDLYNALPSPAPFSLIISNPPYIPTNEIRSLSAEVQKEPHLALDGGESGLVLIERIIKKAPDYLCKGGSLLLEASPNQMETITNLLIKSGFRDIKIYKDLSLKERVIGGRYEA